MLGESPGKLAPVADVVSKPRFLSPAAGGKEPRFRNRDMLGDSPGKPVPIADVVSKPRFLSPAAGGREPRFRNRDMLGEMLGKPVPIADVVSKPRFLSPAAGGKEPRSRALWVLEIAICSANYRESSFPLQTSFLNHGSSRLRREEGNRDLEIATCSAKYW